MIAKLSGVIDSINKDRLLLDVGGVGYQLYCSQKTLDVLPPVGQRFTLYVETVVREDYIHLYGFKDYEEQEWFRLLLTVQGVGMRVALALLSAFHPFELSQAIVGQAKTLITRAEGVGPKLAARIINELKDKNNSFPTSFIPPDSLEKSSYPSVYEDALLALVNLGYRKHEVIEAFKELALAQPESLTVESLIKFGLGKLTRVAS